MSLATLTLKRLRELHAELATSRRADPAPARCDRFELIKRIALLRSTTPYKPPKVVAQIARKPPPVNPRIAMVLNELRRVVYYINEVNVRIAAGEFEAGNFEGEWQTVGLSYSDIVANVRKKYPTVTNQFVRAFVHFHRANEGFIDTLPELRPYSTRKAKTKCKAKTESPSCKNKALLPRKPAPRVSGKSTFSTPR